MTRSVTNEYLHWHQTELVSVTQYRASDVVTDDVTSRRGSLDSNEAGQNPAVTEESIVWLIPGALIESAVKTGDTITDSDDVVYQVVSVREVRLGSSLSHYRCICNKVIL